MPWKERKMDADNSAATTMDTDRHEYTTSNSEILRMVAHMVAYVVATMYDGVLRKVIVWAV
jgi:hypothetical protein